jgi:Mat/Ecp fimbriae major subunit
MVSSMYKKSAATAIAVAILSYGVSAGAATANATAVTTIISAIAIANTSGLNFGNIAPSASGGDVVVDTADTRASCTGGQFCNGTVSSAAFNVTGSAGYTYIITLPASIQTLTRVSGTETVSLSSFTHSISGTPTLSAAGTNSFKVGGTLTVGAGQAAGIYVGSFSVGVDYN